MKRSLLLAFFLAPFFIFSQNYAVQSVTIRTTNPDSCAAVNIDATAFMGCINFSVGSGTYTVNGNAITLELNCTSSPICLTAISYPITSFSISGLNPGTYTINAEAYLDNVMTNSISGGNITIAACSVTGLDQKVIDQLRIYPNPTANQLNIDGLSNFMSSKQVQLFDISAKEMTVNSSQLGKRIQMDLSKLSSGVYFLRIKEGDKVFMHKILRK